MEKLKKSQILNLFIIITLVSITPMVSESLRPPYLYFVVNVLIIAVGAEAGLLKVSDHQDKKKKKKPSSIPTQEDASRKQHRQQQQEEEKSSAMAAATTDDQPPEPVKKSPSTPSLFFVGGGEGEDHQESVPEEEEVDRYYEELTGQELFNKAETFIGNFYNQLKMQREESSKKIHDLYHNS